MKFTVSTAHQLALLGAAALFVFSAGAATAQRAGRQASQTGMSCPNMGSASTTSSTTSAATSATTTASTFAALSGRSVQSGLTYSQRAALGSTAASAASAFSVQRLSASQVAVAWSGSAANAQVAYLGLLDANGQVLSQQAVTRLPVQASLPLSSTARYVGIKLVYQNGASSTSYAPLR